MVRIVTAEETALVPRISGDYSRGGLVRAMVKSLRQAKRPVPKWLSELSGELSAVKSERAVFAMYCFWSGEGCLGRLQGVLSSRTGFAGGHEVVELRYDPDQISHGDLLKAGRGCFDQALTENATQLAAAKSAGISAQTWDGSFRSSSKDDKYQLAHT